jgi:TPP-dependent pyruvate/acetoin dehydrogenase alpha subunit
MGTVLERHQSQPNIAAKAAAYGIPGTQVDGMDVVAVEAATRRAAETVRSGVGPVLLELLTYRFRAHSMYDPELYRTKEEVAQWQARDPVTTFTRRLTDTGVLTDTGLPALERDVAAAIAAAVAEAEAGPWEPVADLLKDVRTPAP